MAEFTPTQGRYLAFIQAYIDSHGYPPAESEIAGALCVSAPSVNQMVKMLEKRGLILRSPGQARSIRLLVPTAEIPAWGNRKRAATRPAKPSVPIPAAPPGNLYVLSVWLFQTPPHVTGSQRVIRWIEIRGDQTLEQLHKAIFEAHDRSLDRPYEFQLGKGSMDRNGPNYREPISGKYGNRNWAGDPRTTRLDELELEPRRVFGYWFDFREPWYHHVQVERIEPAIPTVPYPRVIRRDGKSPPQSSKNENRRAPRPRGKQGPAVVVARGRRNSGSGRLDP